MADVERDPQLLKGVLPILVLTLLTDAESYGYELVTRLRDAGLGGISPGTVYPVLGRLEREGLLASRLQPSPQGRRASATARTRRASAGCAPRSRTWAPPDHWPAGADGAARSFLGVSIVAETGPGQLGATFGGFSWPAVVAVALAWLLGARAWRLGRRRPR